MVIVHAIVLFFIRASLPTAIETYEEVFRVSLRQPDREGKRSRCGMFEGTTARVVRFATMFCQSRWSSSLDPHSLRLAPAAITTADTFPPAPFSPELLYRLNQRRP